MSPPPAAPGSESLRSRTWRIDAELDPLDVAGDDGMLWVREGLSLAARGVAAVVDGTDRAALAAEVARVLAAIETDDEVARPGTGPLALAALPFAADAAATVRVPELLAGRDRDGTRWITWVGSGEPPPPSVALARLTSPTGPRARVVPGEFVVRSERPAHAHAEAVAAARDELRAGAARKVVLARAVTVECDGPIPRLPVLRRLRAAYPTCYLFALPELVGASPELLVSRFGDTVRAQPMAGTVRRSPDPAVDARLAAGLLASHKDRVEHQITIDMVHDTLLPWCSYLDAPVEPEVVSVANVHHLATWVQGRLSKPLPSVLELVGALHPTPAVCGDPRDAALALIARHERLDRGSYAGPVGWVDAAGNGELAVGIRSAELRDNRARLFAGGGVVADSDPDAELDETRVKLEAMLGAIVRP